MKLKEIMEGEYARGRDRDAVRDWQDQIAAQSANRPVDPTRGIWLISREGKRLAGPFASADKANLYKAGRPDRIPANAIVKKL